MLRSVWVGTDAIYVFKNWEEEYWEYYRSLICFEWGWNLEERKTD